MPKKTFYNVQMLSRTFCTVQDFLRQWIVDTFIRQMEKKLCSQINFNIKLNINIKINIDINIIQTLLASLYTLTPFPKISLKHQEDFGLPQCLPRLTSSPPSDHQLWLWVEQFQLAGCPRFLRGRFGQLSITGLGRSNELWRSCAGTLGSTAPGSHKLRWGK